MKHELLFEIGVEELPSLYVTPALEQLEKSARAGLDDLRLSSSEVATLGTPRRLALRVGGLAERQTDFEEEAMGPATRVAFDADGKPTRALLGFCQGRGVDVSAVRRVQTPKGEYVAVTVRHVGKPAAEVLPALLATLATRLSFPKTMRWLTDDTRFARPVRWLTALLDDQVLKVLAFGLTANRATFGHRFLAPAALQIKHARDYAAALTKAHVLVDQTDRAKFMTSQMQAHANGLMGAVVHDDELVEINNFLVEWPMAFRGSFDPHYLDLPREVVITALREHQRFFAVENDKGLLPAFIAICNRVEPAPELVVKGNQDVLVARLEDARFYWQTDLKKTPAEMVEALTGVVWMEGLGTLRDKAARLEALSAWLAERLARATADAVRRAALLCKTDLLSEMIGSGKEYASLEGVMGGHYARRAGESESVAAAIAEHYRPRGPGDSLPATDAGAVLAIADRLDHVAGAFVAGKVPSGSEDPYGVRRAGNGVVRIAVEQKRRLDLRDAAMESTRPFYAADPDLPQAEIMKKLGEFWRGRVEQALDERGVPYDARDAAIESRAQVAGKSRPGWIDPWDCLERAGALETFRRDERFQPLAILFKRVSNILARNSEPLPPSLDRARLTEKVERELADALDRARKATDPLWEKREYAKILPALLEMEHAIHAFFDGVMVNAEDAAVRLNRLRLLSEVRDLFLRGWDLSKVVVEGEKV